MTYSAHDMAQASADGFRSGVASVTVAPTAELVALLPCICGAVVDQDECPYPTGRISDPGPGRAVFQVVCTNPECGWQAIGFGADGARKAWNTRAAAQPQGVSYQDALDAARNRPDGDWHVSDGPSGYQHRILEAGSAFDRTVCDVKESKDARLLAAAPAMFVALCRLSEYGDMSNDAQYGTLSASMVKGIADAAIDAATTPPPAELGEG